VKYDSSGHTLHCPEWKLKPEGPAGSDLVETTFERPREPMPVKGYRLRSTTGRSAPLCEIEVEDDGIAVALLDSSEIPFKPEGSPGNSGRMHLTHSDVDALEEILEEIQRARSL